MLSGQESRALIDIRDYLRRLVLLLEDAEAKKAREKVKDAIDKQLNEGKHAPWA